MAFPLVFSIWAAYLLEAGSLEVWKCRDHYAVQEQITLGGGLGTSGELICNGKQGHSYGCSKRVCLLGFTDRFCWC